ncbi:MAG: M23 family metallopeptidase [bacterium]
MKTKRIIKKIINKLNSLSLNVRLSIAGFLLVAVCIFIAGYSFPKKTVTRVKREKIKEVANSIENVKRNESLSLIFDNHGVMPLEASLVGKALKKYVNPKRLKIDDRYSISVSTAGKVEEFVYMPNLFDKYIVRRVQGVFEAFEEKTDITTAIVGVRGEITGSLWESMSKQEVHPEIIVSFAEMFAWDVDFFNDTRNGDLYWVVWEKKLTEDGREFRGRILGGSYRGKIAQANTGIYFEPPGGKGDYFDLAGKSLRRTFLRAPLSYKRISSHFTYKRFHPILRYYRPHTGIDYAAPSGTPVETIGDGTVIFKGWKGEAGKMVKIKHNSVYTSSYNHLSRYGKGIAEGKKVTQGQVIGYVGSTGLATGPHLDFRFYKFSKPINFLHIRLPSVGNVKEADNEAFAQQKRTILQKVAEMRYDIEWSVSSLEQEE